MNRSATSGRWSVLYRAAWSILILVGILAAVSVFYPQYAQYLELQRREAALEMEFRLEQERLQQLKRDQESLLTDPTFVERIAREELGYAKPGEMVIKFVEDGSAPGENPAP